MVEGANKRNRKQCCLTDEGQRFLKDAISERDKNEQSDSQLAHLCDCDRTVISKIRNRSEPALFKSIDQLFSALGLDLEDHHWDVWREEVKRARSQRQTGSPVKLSRSSQGLTHAEQAANLLWTLNCHAQEYDFQQQYQSGQKLHLIVVQVLDRPIQKWLVKRFTRRYYNVQPFAIHVPSHPMRHDFNQFWEEFRRRLNLPTAHPDEVMQTLCKLAQTKPVFIALFGLHRFGPARDKILEKFWLPLTQKFQAQASNCVKARLTLFLIEDPPNNLQTKLFANLQECCHLTPLHCMTTSEVEDWMRGTDVYPFLCQVIGEDNLELLVETDLPQWGTQPAQVINEVCYAVCLDNGIADIEPYWELAG